MEHLESIKLYEMSCPSCKEGVCEIVILAEDFEEEVRQLKTELMVEPVELDILNTLNEEDRSMRAGEISSLIDVTYQLVGRRTSKLQDLGFVDKAQGEDGHMRSSITTRSQEIHFESLGSEG
jgi:DNA-binding MarR family transcriptional regulator